VTRPAVPDAALKEFAEHSYAGASIRRIADASAGIRHPAVGLGLHRHVAIQQAAAMVAKENKAIQQQLRQRPNQAKRKYIYGQEI
jgi:hypothetical protein